MTQPRKRFSEESADELILDDLGLQRRFPGQEHGVEQWANHQNAESKNRQEEQSAE